MRSKISKVLLASCIGFAVHGVSWADVSGVDFATIFEEPSTLKDADKKRYLEEFLEVQNNIVNNNLTFIRGVDDKAKERLDRIVDDETLHSFSQLRVEPKRLYTSEILENGATPEEEQRKYELFTDENGEEGYVYVNAEGKEVIDGNICNTRVSVRWMGDYLVVLRASEPHPLTPIQVYIGCPGNSWFFFAPNKAGKLELIDSIAYP